MSERILGIWKNCQGVGENDIFKIEDRSGNFLKTKKYRT